MSQHKRSVKSINIPVFNFGAFALFYANATVTTIING